MKNVQIGIAAAFLLLAAVSVTAGPTETEKKLDIEIRTAIARKNFQVLPGLIQQLKGDDVSDQFRFSYCKTFVLSPKFSGPSLKASLDVLVHMYNNDEKNKRVRKGVLQLIKQALGRVQRDEKKFAGLIAFYSKVSDPAAVPVIRKMFTRFKENADVVISVCEALENQRVKESINILNNLYYSSWLRTDYSGINLPPEHEKHLVYFSRISPKMKWALGSLTGRKVKSAKAFNQWWVNTRRKFTVPPKKDDKKDKDKKDKDKKDKDKDKKDKDKKDEDTKKDDSDKKVKF